MSSATSPSRLRVTENGSEVHRTVEMLLLIKNEGAWRIVGQAWDTEGPSKQITHGIDQLRAGARGNSRPDYFWP